MGISKKGSDPSRAERKVKKRKLENAIPDLPGDDGIHGENPTTDSPSKGEKASKKRKRPNEDDNSKGKIMEEGGQLVKKEKKRRKVEENTPLPRDDNGVESLSEKSKQSKREKMAESAIGESSADSAVKAESDKMPRKSKKERKAERKAREAAEKSVQNEDTVSEETTSKVASGANGAIPANSEEKKPKKNNRNREKKRKAVLENGGEGKVPRFIAFIGNLPYSANTTTLQKHFASVKPKSIRHPTEKDNPQKSKGYAFVEFEGYDHMKTCLKLFHHSMFDDGISPPRKINVELTAGGGGNTKDRRAKIEGKNQKLNDERVRRIQEEEKARATKKGDSTDESAIHPSRRARVSGA